MISPVTKIKFDDLTEVIPAFIVIVLMSFTLNLGIGLTAGFVMYPLVMVLSGRGGEIKPGAWVLGAFSALFLVLYPY